MAINLGQPFEGDPYDKAYEYVDMVLLNAPMNGSFHLEDTIDDQADVKKMYSFISKQLRKILKNDLKFTESENPNNPGWISIRLTEAGRKAKILGGYKQYQEFLKKEKDEKLHIEQIFAPIVIGEKNKVSNQSSVSDLKSERSETHNTTSASTPINKSFVSKTVKIIIAIIGALAALVAIYEFIIKNLIIIL